LYPIPKADYRLLEALSAAGAFDESIGEIYVIRQVPLVDEVVTGQGENLQGSTPILRNRPDNGTNQQQPAPTGEDLLQIIDDIAPEKKDPPATPPATPPGAPGAMRPVQDDAQPPQAEPQRPLIDLIEDDGEQGGEMADGSSWIFVNGKWVRVKAATPEEAAALGTQADELITQRVIRVKLKDLLAGKQSINIVIRPGDVVRFPPAGTGFVYMSGEFARPGPYQVVPGLTLLRAVTSAGGYNEIATPWRVDLTRKIGDNRQATIRLDLQAIDAKTQPDIYLKPDDMVSVGTNFWALPVAIVRNGFRTSYGWGFILDRNLSNDLFGPPPVNSVGQ
jgi:polysaccharide export outer membrane protein